MAVNVYVIVPNRIVWKGFEAGGGGGLSRGVGDPGFVRGSLALYGMPYPPGRCDSKNPILKKSEK